MKALNDCHRIPAVCIPGCFWGLEALVFSSLGYRPVLCTNGIGRYGSFREWMNAVCAGKR